MSVSTTRSVCAAISCSLVGSMPTWVSISAVF
jgi:hypothetical protein